MFLHSAWIFHPEQRVAPINSTEPPSLQSTQLSSPPHRGWLAHASRLPLHLSLPRQLSFTELSVVWLAACHRVYTPPPSAFSLPRVEPTTRLRESRRDVCATVPRPRDISCGWYWHLLRLNACRQSCPIKKVCGNGVNAMVAMQLVSTVTCQNGDWKINYTAKLKINQLGCKILLNVNLTLINLYLICKNIYFSTFPLYRIFWDDILY